MSVGISPSGPRLLRADSLASLITASLGGPVARVITARAAGSPTISVDDATIFMRGVQIAYVGGINNPKPGFTYNIAQIDHVSGNDVVAAFGMTQQFAGDLLAALPFQVTDVSDRSNRRLGIETGRAPIGWLTSGETAVGVQATLTIFPFPAGTAAVIESLEAILSSNGAGGGTVRLEFRDTNQAGALLWNTTMGVQNVAGATDRVHIENHGFKMPNANSMWVGFSVALAGVFQDIAVSTWSE